MSPFLVTAMGTAPVFPTQRPQRRSPGGSMKRHIYPETVLIALILLAAIAIATLGLTGGTVVGFD